MKSLVRYVAIAVLVAFVISRARKVAPMMARCCEDMMASRRASASEPEVRA